VGEWHGNDWFITEGLKAGERVVVEGGLSLQKKSSNILMILALCNQDGRYSPEYVDNYANVYVLDAVRRINGAGQATFFGVADQTMCIVLLRHEEKPQRGFFAWFNRRIDRITLAFGHAVTLIIKRMVPAFVLLAFFLWSLVQLFLTIPAGFVTNEDQGCVMAAMEYTRLAQLQYDGGYVPYSTVLQAQEQLFPAELNYALYRTALLTSLVDIYKAMGGGWVTLAARMTAGGS